MAALGPSEDFLATVYVNPRERAQAIENIALFLSGMTKEKRNNDWKGILNDMKSIKIILTNNGRKPLPRAPNSLATIDGCMNRVQESINLADMSRGDGADPRLILGALKTSIDLEATLIEPEGWGLDRRHLDLSAVCGRLDAMRADRAIVCGSGHFIALRKTTNDGWCIVDSEKNDVIPVNEGGRERSLVEGRPFYGIIFSPTADLADQFADQLVHY